jgi:YfiH family protein
LNLGWTASDEFANVTANRARLVAEVGSGMELVTVRQVHSVVTQVIAAGHGELSQPDGKAVLEGDGLMTDLPGLLLGVQTADCVPVLLADTRKRVVAAFHAGWRGTVAAMVELGAREMLLQYGSEPGDLIAAVGPSIGPCCFEVGDEVRTEFAPELHHGRAVDLWEANRRQKVAAGVPTKCTACTRVEDGGRKYFSHRAEKGFTGRMLSVVGVVPQ